MWRVVRARQTLNIHTSKSELSAELTLRLFMLVAALEIFHKLTKGRCAHDSTTYISLCAKQTLCKLSRRTRPDSLDEIYYLILILYFPTE